MKRLDYIWVESYKGFENQGFNFATQFEYAFEPSSSHLSRRGNEKYIENLFGVDIIEVTGIIGKNASGKTNILELIQYVVNGGNTIINRPFLAVFSNSGVFELYTYRIPKVSSDFETNSYQYKNGIGNTNSIFFSNVFDGRQYNFDKKTINISSNTLLQANFGENVSKVYQRSIQTQIKFINSNYFEILEAAEQKLLNSQNSRIRPSDVILVTPLWSNILNRIKIFEKKFRDESGYKIELLKFAQNFRSKITKSESQTSFKYFTAFLVVVDFILNRNGGKTVNEGQHNNSDVARLVEHLTNLDKREARIDEIFDFITTDFANQIDQFWPAFETSKFLYDLKYFDLSMPRDHDFKENLGSYSNRRIQFKLPYTTNLGYFLSSYFEAVTNQSLSYSFEWSGLSSGHKAYINLFASFFSAISQINSDTVLICIDEGDLYFHPKWQTEFLTKLIDILPSLLGKRCQIFLTTHSPFLVSDLPKSNLIFVERNNDNLRVIPNRLIDGETFGGNIGELYLDAFFMDGNLISNFAAFKIQQLVDKLRSGSGITEQDRILVSNIGEELIRTQINKLIDDTN